MRSSGITDDVHLIEIQAAKIKKVKHPEPNFRFSHLMLTLLTCSSAERCAIKPQESEKSLMVVSGTPASTGLPMA